MQKFLITETISTELETVRFGTTSNKFTDADKGKAVKLAADSQFNLCALGDPIEGFCIGLQSATSDGFTLGSYQDDSNKIVTYDGAEATGTGTAAIGDYVVAGTPVALNTALSTDTGYQRVRTAKATTFPGAVPANVAEAGRQAQLAVYAWRIVSLGTAGTGAVGTRIVIQRANY